MARPTKYKPEFVEQARELCEQGATDREVAHALGFSETSLYEYQNKYPEFAQALKVSKAVADDRVERSLYRRAVGYSFDAVKIVKNKGEEAVHIPYVEHVPPDTTAMIFWLKNRRKEQWRDRHELTGSDGSPLTIQIVDPTRRADPTAK
jgi:hypothetical protein